MQHFNEITLMNKWYIRSYCSCLPEQTD